MPATPTVKPITKPPYLFLGFPALRNFADQTSDGLPVLITARAEYLAPTAVGARMKAQYR